MRPGVAKRGANVRLLLRKFRRVKMCIPESLRKSACQESEKLDLLEKYFHFSSPFSIADIDFGWDNQFSNHS